MKVKFVSRWDAKQYIKEGYFSDADCDFVSISDTNKEASDMKKLWLENKKESNAAVFLRFQDIDGSSSGFDQKKAETITRFLDVSFKKKKDVLVHCFAGISRSGAVAKFVNEYYGLGDEYLETYAGHNLWVFYTLLEVAGVPTMRQYYTDLEKRDENDK
jgi:protein-tyrosine phosphatase